jgi:signal transduction histidine kinase
LKKDKTDKKGTEKPIGLLEKTDPRIAELTEVNRQLKRKIFDLYTIFEISRNFTSVLNYRTLVDSFLLTSLGQMGASAAALYIPPDLNSEAMVLASTKGLHQESELRREIPIDGKLSDYMVSVAKPVPLTDLTGRFPELERFAKMQRFKNGLIIPLILQSQLKGFLVISGKIAGGEFSIDDTEFLSILANQFAVALENARLYESERDAFRELKTAQDHLLHTEKLAAVGELSAKIAHEVNNPLSIISNYLMLIQKRAGESTDVDEYLSIVTQEVSRIARIVRQLLDFNRPHKVTRKPLDVIAVIEDVLNLLEYQLANQKINITRQYDENLPRIVGVAEQLKQVFLNIILNARDFMPEGGDLTVTAELLDEQIRLAVVDTGPGIPEEVLPHIFEPFFTTKGDEAGTGLGLSVCYGIIKDHGGKIVAQNKIDGGSQFVVYLPVEERKEQEA